MEAAKGEAALTKLTAAILEGKKNYVEWYKDNLKGTMEEELADIILRTLDFAHAFGVDIGTHVAAKIMYNESNDKPKEGGKRY